jgi:hypothetical protein
VAIRKRDENGHVRIQKNGCGLKLANVCGVIIGTHVSIAKCLLQKTSFTTSCKGTPLLHQQL